MGLAISAGTKVRAAKISIATERYVIASRVEVKDFG